MSQPCWSLADTPSAAVRESRGGRKWYHGGECRGILSRRPNSDSPASGGEERLNLSRQRDILAKLGRTHDQLGENKKMSRWRRPWRSAQAGCFMASLLSVSEGKRRILTVDLAKILRFGMHLNFNGYLRQPIWDMQVSSPLYPLVQAIASKIPYSCITSAS